jgi:hypothetical protein
MVRNFPQVRVSRGKSKERRRTDREAGAGRAVGDGRHAGELRLHACNFPVLLDPPPALTRVVARRAVSTEAMDSRHGRVRLRIGAGSTRRPRLALESGYRRVKRNEERKRIVVEGRFAARPRSSSPIPAVTCCNSARLEHTRTEAGLATRERPSPPANRSGVNSTSSSGTRVRVSEGQACSTRPPL